MTDFADKVNIDDVTCLKETHKGDPDAGALLVLVGNDEFWVPKSQIDDESEVYTEGDEGTLIISEYWFSNKLNRSKTMDEV